MGKSFPYSLVELLAMFELLEGSKWFESIRRRDGSSRNQVMAAWTAEYEKWRTNYNLRASYCSRTMKAMKDQLSLFRLEVPFVLRRLQSNTDDSDYFVETNSILSDAVKQRREAISQSYNQASECKSFSRSHWLVQTGGEGSYRNATAHLFLLRSEELLLLVHRVFAMEKSIQDDDCGCGDDKSGATVSSTSISSSLSSPVSSPLDGANPPILEEGEREEEESVPPGDHSDDEQKSMEVTAGSSSSRKRVRVSNRAMVETVERMTKNQCDLISILISEVRQTNILLRAMFLPSTSTSTSSPPSTAVAISSQTQIPSTTRPRNTSTRGKRGVCD